MTAGAVGFAVFGLTSQTLLVAFFGARRWTARCADGLGRLAYGFGALGLPLAGWLVMSGESMRIAAGPLLLAGWAALGIYADLWRPIPWRGPVIDWRVMAPYVAVYVLAQMFLWWPLWDLARGAWAAFGVLFAVNTGLNLRGHAASATARHR